HGHHVHNAPLADARLGFALHQIDHHFPGLVNRRPDATGHFDVLGHCLPGVTAVSAFVNYRDANRPANGDCLLDNLGFVLAVVHHAFFLVGPWNQDRVLVFDFPADSLVGSHLAVFLLGNGNHHGVSELLLARDHLAYVHGHFLFFPFRPVARDRSFDHLRRSGHGHFAWSGTWRRCTWRRFTAAAGAAQAKSPALDGEYSDGDERSQTHCQ